MTLTRQMQPSFTAGEISPSLYARVDLTKYQTGLKSAKNVYIYPHGGAANRPGFEFCDEVRDGAGSVRLVTFQFNTEQSYVLELGPGYMRFHRDGAQVLTDPQLPVLGISQGNPAFVNVIAHGYSDGDEVYLFNGIGMPQAMNRNYRVANASGDYFSLVDLYGNAIDSTSFGAYLGSAYVGKVYEIATPWIEFQVEDVQYVQEADVMYLVHPLHAPRKLSRIADANWTLVTPTFAPSIVAPTGVTAVKTTGTATTISYQYKVSAVSLETGEESLPSTASTAITNDLTISGNKNTVSWSAVAGAARYVVYKLDNGVYGYIGGTEGLSFVDQNIVSDLSDTPQTGNNPFVGEGNYPRCATFFEQRLVFASTLSNPQAVFMSQSANYENFGSSSPQKSADAITFRIRARQINEIRSMVPTKGLMLLTSGAEWIITGGSNDIITPGSILSKNQGYRGASKLSPLVVGNVVLFAQRSGGVVRDFSYDFAEDSFTGSDLTILSRHLFRGRQIKSWCYAQAPDSVVWCVLTDGSLVSLTYMREHEVWAWTRHETDGFFEDCTVVQEPTEDVPYFVVVREVNGQTKRYIERLASRDVNVINDAFFLDCGLRYVGAPANYLYGFWHLEGKTVSALADGAVIKDLVVTNGAITLPSSAENVVVGLPYLSEIETLALDAGAVQGLGTVQGRNKSIASVTVRVEKSRGLFVGPSRTRMREWKQRSSEPYNTPVDLFTGDFEVTMDPEWNRNGNVVIQQPNPLPMAVLAVMPDVAIGG